MKKLGTCFGVIDSVWESVEITNRLTFGRAKVNRSIMIQNSLFNIFYQLEKGDALSPNRYKLHESTLQTMHRTIMLHVTDMYILFETIV